jgi:hypothetical protein
MCKGSARDTCDFLSLRVVDGDRERLRMLMVKTGHDRFHCQFPAVAQVAALESAKLIIQGVANLSVNIAKRSAQRVSPKGIVIDFASLESVW